MSAWRLVRIASAAATLTVGVVALHAQVQLNTQVYGTTGPSTSVRYAPQYLGGQPTAPSSARLMPSEVRNYYATSGSLPSDMRMGYARVGPLSPTGPVAYIPPPQYSDARGVNTSQGNLVDTSVQPVTPVGGYSPSSTNLHSIRHGAAPTVGATPIYTQFTNTSVSANPYDSAVPGVGTIRYGSK
jgi:hypothetical protein